MHPFKAFGNLFKKKITDPMAGFNINTDTALWQSIGGNTYAFYRRNDMENGYASIRVIVNNFAKIEPYAIDAKGKSVSSPVLDRIYTPNTSMSAYEFREALAVMSLVHNKVLIRVHHTEGVNIRAETILGFTFIEQYTESIIDGKRYYRLPSGITLGDDEVITLLNINPYDVDAGFSPAYAAKRWTTLDDYIADYQKGFFENGAVPSGQLVITTASVKDFNDTVDMLKHRHQGAAKSGNITYTHRPLDPTGKPQQAGIEWQPFATANNNLGMAELFANVNKKIDSAYGVPASLRGVNENNTYASVKVDQRILIDNVIEPLVMKVWGKFTHELNRITGGIGVAITAEVETPDVADEKFMEAQAKQVEANILNTMVMLGYEVPAIVDAFELCDSIKKLGNAKPMPDDDEPEVVEATQPDTPEQPIDATSKRLAPRKRIKYENMLSDVVRNRMTSQINNVIETYDAISKAITTDKPVEETEDELLAQEMLAVLILALKAQGKVEQQNNIQLALQAGLNIDPSTPFKFTKEQYAKYKSRIEKIAVSYNAETAEKIRNVIEIGISQGQTAQEIKDGLGELIKEEYRVNRIAVTEVNHAGNQANLDSLKNIADETGAHIIKYWKTFGSDPCEFCLAMANEDPVELHENFLDEGHAVHGVNGGTFVNDFTDIDSAELHPNCQCGFVTEFVKD